MRSGSVAVNREAKDPELHSLLQTLLLLFPEKITVKKKNQTPLCKAVINPTERAPLPWCVGRGMDVKYNIQPALVCCIMESLRFKYWFIFCVLLILFFFSVRDLCFPLIFRLLCPFWGFGWWEGRIQNLNHIKKLLHFAGMFVSTLSQYQVRKQIF